MCRDGGDAALLCRGDATGPGGKGGAGSEKTGGETNQPESHSVSDGKNTKTLGNVSFQVTVHSAYHCKPKKYYFFNKENFKLDEL